MSEEPPVLQGYTGKFQTMSDESVKLEIFIQPADAVKAAQLFISRDVRVGIARLHEPGEEKQKREYGVYAEALKKSSFFRNPTVWAAVGTDKQYLEWLKRQKSCISKSFEHWDDNGDGYSIPCHVRRANNSGTGIKPEYHAVPMSNDQHTTMQHQHGELFVLQNYSILNQNHNVNDAKDWFDRKAIYYVSLWCWQTLKEYLGYESWKYVPPEDLRKWAIEKEVVQLLPREYQEQ